MRPRCHSLSDRVVGGRGGLDLFLCSAMVGDSGVVICEKIVRNWKDFFTVVSVEGVGLCVSLGFACRLYGSRRVVRAVFAFGLQVLVSV